MSQENVEIVRAAMAVYQHPEGMALLASGDIDLSLFDTEIEWDASRLDEAALEAVGLPTSASQ